jgi:hypothetical protein
MPLTASALKARTPRRGETRYDDGRAVMSVMPVDDAGLARYIHCWHPAADHPMNQRGELETVTLHDATRKKVLVSAPGVLDSVSLPPLERSVNRASLS